MNENYDFGYDFSEINRYKNFTEYDELNWDYFGDDDDDVDDYYKTHNQYYENGYGI